MARLWNTSQAGRCDRSGRSNPKPGWAVTTSSIIEYTQDEGDPRIAVQGVEVVADDRRLARLRRTSWSGRLVSVDAIGIALSPCASITDRTDGEKWNAMFQMFQLPHRERIVVQVERQDVEVALGAGVVHVGHELHGTARSLSRGHRRSRSRSGLRP